MNVGFYYAGCSGRQLRTGRSAGALVQQAGRSTGMKGDMRRADPWRHCFADGCLSGLCAGTPGEILRHTGG